MTDKLKKRAEPTMDAKSLPDISEMSVEDIEKLVHKLHLQQIELDLQQEELTATRAQLERTMVQKAESIEAAAAETAIDTMNAMGEGVALCDTHGKIRTVNPAFAALTDCDQKKLLGAKIQDLLPGLFNEPEKTVLETIARIQLKSSAKDPDDALSITTSTGIRKWVLPALTMIHGPQREIIGIVLTLRDISRLVESQSKLGDSERKYRELVENANSIIMRISPDQRITFFNEYAQRFFGYTAEEVLGKSVVGTIAAERDSSGRDLRQVMEAISAYPEAHKSNDNENIRKDGSRVWMHWSNRAIHDAQGELKEILCIGTDLTERKRLEQEADAYRRRLRALAASLTITEEKERRRVATQLHDTVIQTLSLVAIRLGGIMAAVDQAGLTEQKEQLKRIRQLLDQGTKECRGLMQELVPSLLYEVGLIAALKDFAQKQSELHTTRIVINEDDQLPTLDDALRVLLFQAARELVMNALKYAGPCAIDVSVSADDESVRLCVRDTGCGFDVTELDDKQYDETGGFGLFNIRERLLGEQGQLTMESTPGEGTTATVRVPLEQAKRN